jgi:hypothetical protein
MGALDIKIVALENREICCVDASVYGITGWCFWMALVHVNIHYNTSFTKVTDMTNIIINTLRIWPD